MGGAASKELSDETDKSKIRMADSGEAGSATIEHGRKSRKEKNINVHSNSVDFSLQYGPVGPSGLASNLKSLAGDEFSMASDHFQTKASFKSISHRKQVTMDRKRCVLKHIDPNVGAKETLEVTFKNNGEKYKINIRENGAPDFVPFAYEGGANVVKINLTGNSRKDIAVANNKCGYNTTPKGFVWHHSEIAGILILVDVFVHNSVSHIGGAYLGRNKV